MHDGPRLELRARPPRGGQPPVGHERVERRAQQRPGRLARGVDGAEASAANSTYARPTALNRSMDERSPWARSIARRMRLASRSNPSAATAVISAALSSKWR